MSDYTMIFHRRVGFPERLVIPTGTFEVEKTGHAKERAHDNKYGSYKIPNEITFSEEHIKEIKMKGRSIWRVFVRKEYNDEFDVCYVLEFPNFRLITTWRNKKDDTKDDSLELDKYNDPEDFAELHK